jgi:acetolactate synthase-1/2/3 large subunit
LTKYTGGEIVAEYLKKERVPYIVGIPGHGIIPFLDPFKDRKDTITAIQVRHEQSAVHLADGYYRASGRPLLCFTSIGPGAYNTVVGLATAYMDSSAVVVVSGETHTYMYGRGVLQELERKHWSDTSSVMRPLVKRVWKVTMVEQIPNVIQQAFKVSTTGRPGPVHIFIPMDVQASSADVKIPEPAQHRPKGRAVGDIAASRKGAELLVRAERPVILAGGGVILSDASHELVRLAEFLGAPIITTMMGKGSIPEDHSLCAFYAGSKGSSCGNKLAREADVLLAVGCRFADLSTSSYKHGASFSIPPTRLIHVDIDPTEIGKNYPTEIGIVGDAKAVLRQFINFLKEKAFKNDYQEKPYFKAVQKAKDQWRRDLENLLKSGKKPMTISRFLAELRQLLERDAIVVGSAGHPQAALFQEFPIYEPRTHLSSGGMSTMGWAVPASMGAKLARPNRQVVSISGDGDFLMTCQELATGVQYGIPTIHFVLNNYGWLSIRDLQIDTYGLERSYATEFRYSDTSDLYSPSFTKLAEAFGCHTEFVDEPQQIDKALNRSFESKKPSVIEVSVNRKHPWSEGKTFGWWDVPVPTYLRKDNV